MNNTQRIVSAYTLLHLAIDFTTVFLVCKVLLGPKVGMISRGHVIILYNLIAFAGQLPLGIVCDIFSNKQKIVGLGCALTGIAYPVALISPWVACIIAALGNAVFHVGAGSDILDLTMPKAGASGLFVSSGALGVWLAYKSYNEIFMWVCPALILFFAVIVASVNIHKKISNNNTDIRFTIPNWTIVLSIVCLMSAIAFRSLLGMIMNFSWKVIPVWDILYITAIVLGKASGGYISDKIGWIKATVLSLVSAFVLFIYSFNYPICGVLGICFFNMTMPLTLTAIANVCDKKCGFAFGLTTFALAIGFIPTVFGANNRFGIPLLLISVALSFVLMLLGYCLIKLKLKMERK